MNQKKDMLTGIESKIEEILLKYIKTHSFTFTEGEKEAELFLMEHFSSIKYFGLHSFRSRTNSKNNLLRGSSKFNCLPLKLKPWHGLPPINKSIFGRFSAFTSVTLPSCIVFGKLC